jgi:hypothetical protein
MQNILTGRSVLCFAAKALKIFRKRRRKKMLVGNEQTGRLPQNVEKGIFLFQWWF